jgi:hypothetical protein
MLGLSVEIRWEGGLPALKRKPKQSPKNSPLAHPITGLKTSHAFRPIHAGDGWILQHI